MYTQGVDANLSTRHLPKDIVGSICSITFASLRQAIDLNMFPSGQFPNFLADRKELVGGLPIQSHCHRNNRHLQLHSQLHQRKEPLTHVKLHTLPPSAP